MRKFIFLFATTVAYCSLAGPSFAQSSGGQPDWLSQAKLMADMEGTSVGEQVRRARLQAKAERQAEKFAADDDYAGSWIQHDKNSYKVVFGFKGGGSKAIADPELASDATTQGVRYSMKEIQEERRRLTAALRAEGINASFEIQPQQNRILLYPSDPAKLQTLISSGGLTLRDFVIVQNKPLTRKPEAAIEGGGDTSGTYVDPVDKQTYGNNCSAAFSVVSGSVRGISTAGHCAQYSGQTQYHRGANIGTFQSRQQATGVDAAWFRNTANTYTNRVRWNSTTYYSITGIASASPAIGSSICLIKRDTTQLCAYVKSTGIYFGDDGPYVAADRDVSVSGDSGGPWLYGGLAYGIHSGDVDTSVGTLSFFTPGPSLSQMGLSIATN